MLRIRVSYSDKQEKDRFINELKEKFPLKVYKDPKKEGPYRKAYIDLYIK